MKVLFLGADGVGKTHLMLILAKIISKLDKEVLILDENDMGTYNYFNYNVDVEEEIAVTKQNTEIIRDGIEIKTGFNKIDNMNIEKYDYIFVEKNSCSNLELKDFDKVFILQNYDKEKLVRNINILKYYSEYSFSNVNFIFNQMLDTTANREYLLNELMNNIKNKVEILNNEDFEIKFNEIDLVVSSVNKFNGEINLKNYSNEFKESIYQIINSFEKIDNKVFKKIVEGRRFL